jgi:uncharacterized protein YbaR (Trm112 family)
MFIELTDHLRCTADHEEQFLVLLPDRMEGRRVVTGTLGCPRCGRVVRIDDGVAAFGDPPPAAGSSALAADGARALLAIDGPGGFVALVAGAAALAAPLAALLPGVHFALVNPPAGAPPAEAASVLVASRLPVKAASMRGVVVGPGPGGDPAWVDAAIGAVLPGNRVVVEGPVREGPGREVLAEAAGVWVARRRPQPVA